MAKIGGDPRALGTILLRIARRPGPLANILLDHPATHERAAAIETLARPTMSVAPLDSSEWAAVKQICAEK